MNALTRLIDALRGSKRDTTEPDQPEQPDHPEEPIPSEEALIEAGVHPDEAKILAMKYIPAEGKAALVTLIRRRRLGK